ncbi:MAG: pentapeptide repeat-containing protein [Planctomycetota bacterium]
MLSSAVLSRAVLSGAVLSGAIVSGAIVSDAMVSDAVLRRGEAMGKTITAGGAGSFDYGFLRSQ